MGTSPSTLVEAKLDFGQRGVVACNLQAVESSDEGESPPVLAQDWTVVSGVLLLQKHKRRERAAAKEHMDRRKGEWEAEAVHAQGPTVEHAEAAVEAEEGEH